MSESSVDRIYERAADATGKSVEELRRMSVSVFASMLLHAIEKNPGVVWTVASIEEGRLIVEVDVPRRPRPRPLITDAHE